MNGDFTRAARSEAVAEGQVVGLTLSGWPVLLARVDGSIRATIDRCTHAAAALSGGRVRRGAIMCPLHGARFDLASGRCLGGGYAPLLVFAAREVEDCWIEVAVPSTPPGSEHLPVRPRA